MGARTLAQKGVAGWWMGEPWLQEGLEYLEAGRIADVVILTGFAILRHIVLRTFPPISKWNEIHWGLGLGVVALTAMWVFGMFFVERLDLQEYFRWCVVQSLDGASGRPDDPLRHGRDRLHGPHARDAAVRAPVPPLARSARGHRPRLSNRANPELVARRSPGRRGGLNRIGDGHDRPSPTIPPARGTGNGWRPTPRGRRRPLFCFWLLQSRVSPKSL